MRSYGVWRNGGGTYGVTRLQGVKPPYTLHSCVRTIEDVLSTLARLPYATVSSVWLAPESLNHYGSLWIGDRRPSALAHPQGVVTGVSYPEALEVFTAYLRMM